MIDIDPRLLPRASAIAKNLTAEKMRALIKDETPWARMVRAVLPVFAATIAAEQDLATSPQDTLEGVAGALSTLIGVVPDMFVHNFDTRHEAAIDICKAVLAVLERGPDHMTYIDISFTSEGSA